MADYQQPDRRHVPRPADYGGHSSNSQRDAAFSNIFGAAPPPGRTQTLTSGVPPPDMGYNQQSQDGRSPTMSSMSSSNSMQRMPPPRGPPPGAGYGPGPNMSQRTRTMDSSMSNGYNQGFRSASGGQVPSPQAQYLQQQQQMRRYPGQPVPPRIDARPPLQGGYSTMRTPQRFNPGGPPPAAMNSDPYRTQSLASAPRQQMYNPPPQSYQQSPANAFRHAQYANNNQARTTAQGRVVPERHDDRAMSMTGNYSSHDRDSHQTMSGRVIPNRRVPGAGSISEIPHTNGYAPHAPGAQTRTTSMTSSTSGNGDHRTMSMSSTIAPSIAPSAVTEVSQSATLTNNRASGSQSVDGERPPTARVRTPIVYPAMLSAVAEVFRQKIMTGDRTKNELTYKDAFSGTEAVDVLSYIIRTTDRNLALLLGRALDAQKFFHDVTYEHRLRDSTSEMYQFREKESEAQPVNGVFVLLSECYSPTCTRDQLCYSIACPRRLEQVSRLNLGSRPVLQGPGGASLDDDNVDQTDEQKLWVNSVPKEVADAVSDREKKRQEIISEICYTERDFVKDLEYLRDFWINPLRQRNMSTIPLQRREKVVRNIFTNIVDQPSIHGVSSRFAKALTERQNKAPVVRNVGDIFLEYATQFEPFIIYGSKQLEAKYEFENEKATNPNFAKYVEEIERRKESRKLELNGYLTKPTTRLARYPLLLEGVLKLTEDDNPDKQDLPKVLVVIRDFLQRVNAESGKAENRFTLRRLSDTLMFRPNERVDLKLTKEGRELIFKSQLKKSPTDPSDITVYLLDHAVLLVRTKTSGSSEQHRAYRRPIPLELLSIKEMDEVIPSQGAVRRSTSSLLPLRNNNDAKRGEGWPITFRHLGRHSYELTLYAANQAARQKWLEHIDAAQQKLRAKADFLNTTVLSSGFFTATNKVNCMAPIDGGRKLIYGTDNGIYISDRRNRESRPKRVIEAQSVTQFDVLEEYQLLLVLSNRTLFSYPLSALDPTDQAVSKRPKKIQGHCTFFKTGICLGRHLVCCVKPSAMSSTFKVYEPNDAMSKAKKQKGFGKMFNAGQDELTTFKEFYIPAESTSVDFLRSSVCVASARGFEVVSLKTLETQALLDQADTSLDFVARPPLARPIHIERLNGEFLLNYSDFSFFVNRNGWRARPEWRIDWEGTPQSFALSYPWILAFEPNFIELHHIETRVVHIVPHRNIRMLHSSTHEIIYAYEDERGEDVVEAMDFWAAQRRSEMPDGAENVLNGAHPR